MSHETHSTCEDLTRQLDRLVDGELRGEEYRRLLADLDRHPADWKQCALAFLEAQAWRRDLAGVLDDAQTLPAAPVAAREPSTMAAAAIVHPDALEPPSHKWTLLLVSAASFLVAFVLGSSWNGPAHRPEPAVQPIAEIKSNSLELAANDNADSDAQGATTAQRPNVPAVEQDSDAQNSIAQNSANRDLESPASPAGDPAARAPELVGPNPLGALRVTLAGDEAAAQRSMDIPVYESESFGEEWLTSAQSAIEPETISALREQGHEISRTRRLYPVTLGDGRQVVLPVEEFDIVPAVNRSFQ